MNTRMNRSPNGINAMGCEHGRNLRRCAVTVTIVFTLSVLTLLTACSRPEIEFGREAAPDKGAELIVTVTEPSLPHGKHRVTIYIQQGDTPAVMVATEMMENDGVPFTQKNIALRWTSNATALVCLRPTDLTDKGVRISLRPEPHAEVRDGC